MSDAVSRNTVQTAVLRVVLSTVCATLLGSIAFAWVDSALPDNYDTLHSVIQLARVCDAQPTTVSELRKQLHHLAITYHPDKLLGVDAPRPSKCTAEKISDALSGLKRMHPATSLLIPRTLAPLIGSPSELAPQQCATYIVAFCLWLILVLCCAILLYLCYYRELDSRPVDSRPVDSLSSASFILHVDPEVTPAEFEKRVQNIKQLAKELSLAAFVRQEDYVAYEGENKLEGTDMIVELSGDSTLLNHLTQKCKDGDALDDALQHHSNRPRRFTSPRRKRGGTASQHLVFLSAIGLALVTTESGFDRAHAGLQVGFPLKYTKTVEADLKTIMGPPCAPDCDFRYVGGLPDPSIKRCIDHGYIFSSQYIYRYDHILKVCHYHATDIPSYSGRIIGYGASYGIFVIIILAIGICTASPIGGGAILILGGALMMFVMHRYYYVLEPSLNEAMQITTHLYGPVNEYKWDWGRRGPDIEL